MFLPARHPSPIGRTAPQAGTVGPVIPCAARVDGTRGIGRRASRPMARGVGWADACPEPRVLRERAKRCLQGRAYGHAALLYAQAEHLTRMLDPESSDLSELVVLARHCHTLATKYQR